MTREEAIAVRLRSQLLVSSPFERAEEVVGWMGMVQAQDYRQFRWAIGTRMRTPKMSLVSDSFSSGRIVRLHLLRCTVLSVAIQDYLWMLDLCRDRNLNTVKSWPSYNKTGFSELYCQEGFEALKGILADGRSLTKKQIGEEFSKSGLPGDIAHLNQVLLRGEIEGLLLSGEMKGNDATWALAEERLKALGTFRGEENCRYPADESLTVLARKYFRSHSPASFEDFCWWTGLPVTQNRKAVQLIAPELEEVKMENRQKEEQTMFVYKDCISDAAEGCGADRLNLVGSEKSVILLPSYDEYLIGYKSRWVSLDKIHEHKAYNRFGIFNPVVLYNGKVVGNWKTSFSQKAKTIETELFSHQREVGIRRLNKAKEALHSFCQ